MTVSEITPAALAALARSRAVDLIDVRTPAEYVEIHTPLARSLPLDQLDPTKVQALRQGPADQPLYVICRSGSRGRQACEKLLAAGCANVVNVSGGTLAWEQAGLEVVRGRKTMSLDRQVRIAIGALVLAGSVLGGLVHPVFCGLAGFCGAGLIFAGVTDTCAMAMLVARMPWNQRTSCCGG